MKDIKDWFTFFLSLGPVWGPALGSIALLGYAVYRTQKQGARGFCGLFLNAAVLTTFVSLLLGLPTYYVWYYRFRGLPKPFREGEIGILVGEVPGDENRAKQIAYVQAIRKLVTETPEVEHIVSVRLLERQLPVDPEEQHAEATKIGHWLHASFVLRPYSVGGVQQPWLSVIDQPDFSRTEVSLPSFLNLRLANLDSISLPGDVLLLARCALAVSLYRRSSFGSAKRELQVVLSSPSLPPVAPSRADLNLLLGDVLLRTGSPGDAVKVLRTAIELRPSYAPAHDNLGVALRFTNDYVGAANEFRRAISLGDDSYQVHMNLCGVLEFAESSRYDEALTECEKAVQLKPDVAMARVNLGGALRLKGRESEAIAEFRKAIELDPLLGAPHYNLGLGYEQNGDIERAIAEYQKAIALDPGDYGGHNNLGRLFLHKKMYRESIVEFEKAIELDPGGYNAHLNYCAALLYLERSKEALVECKKPPDIAPNSPDAHTQLGTAYYQSREYSAATTEYKTALRLNPGSSEAHYNFGILLRATGKKKEAEKEFRESSRLEKAHELPRQL